MTHDVLIAAVAAVCMLATDFLSTVLVQAEATNRPWIAAGCDALGWGVSITTTSIAVNVLTGGHASMLEQALVVAFVTAANFFGTAASVTEGSKLLARWPKRQADNRVAGLEHRVRALENELHWEPMR